MPHFATPDISNFTGLFSYINNVTTQTTPAGITISLFGPGLLIMIFSIVLISLKLFETEKAFVVAMFITMFSSFFLSVIGLVDGATVLICVSLALGSVLILYLFDRK